MTRDFPADPFPGRPRILFVGLGASSHTHSWIDLLAPAALNVRLFALPTEGVPPAEWLVRTYVTEGTSAPLDIATRRALHARSVSLRRLERGLAKVVPRSVPRDVRWLADVIRSWRPDVVHTFGLDQGGEFYFQARQLPGVRGIGRWVLQLRGGSDLQLTRLDPSRAATMGTLLAECDQILTDNEQNVEFLSVLGVQSRQLAPLLPVPGTGGVEVDALAKAGARTPSARRMLLWPKAYECPWAKSLPVLEALSLCWERLPPFEIAVLAANAETRNWLPTLPPTLRSAMRVEGRIPRPRALALMADARVMLAPSLVDGTPNSLFEAMAAGAFPIVSPLPTLRPLVRHERNVLFARNLYPEEIADAIVRAMTDDVLVDAARGPNLEAVRARADRATIGPRVITYYESLARLAVPKHAAP